MNVPTTFSEHAKAHLFAGAFLRWQDEVILMQRSPHKKIAPGLWAGIGGHIEQSEMNSPALACLREIEEETGIVPAQIDSIDLRYFALLKSEETLHSIYYFSVVLKEKCTLRQTSEGTLHWVKLSEGVQLQMSSFMKQFYTHWINNLSDTSFHCFLDSDFHLLP